MAAAIARYPEVFQPWEGSAFRSSPLEFARSKTLIDGRGAYENGSRWCAPGHFFCLNLSTAANTALEESHAAAAYYGWIEKAMAPRVLVEVSLKLHRVIDFVASPILAVELAMSDMLEEDWRAINDSGHEALGQALGRAAQAARAEAIIVRSARVKEGVNMVIFPQRIEKSGSIQVIGHEELDRWLKKR